MLITIRLCGADRERFDAPEELVLDLEALKDLEYDAYEAIEEALRSPLSVFLPALESGSLGQAIVKRIAVFLALRLAGKTVAWDDCKPRPARTECERQVDADPPAGPSESSSEDAPRKRSSKP